MYQSIEAVLGDRWLMFFHAQWPVDRVRPVCDLETCIEQCNRNLHTLGRDIKNWPPGDINQIARLLRVNWIYSRLDHEPIRKPILVHGQGQDLMVDCGDTRVMALKLAGQQWLSVIATDHAHAGDRYGEWEVIRTNEDLRRHTGFAADAEIWLRAGKTQAVEWLEIGDQTTAHHLHDQDQRIRMMQAYLNKQPVDFRFDQQWARGFIDWTDADPTDPATI